MLTLNLCGLIFFASLALDMQQCGVSTEGAMAFQPVLKFNTTITVLDLRLNPLIGKSVKQALSFLQSVSL